MVVTFSGFLTTAVTECPASSACSTTSFPVRPVPPNTSSRILPHTDTHTRLTHQITITFNKLTHILTSRGMCTVSERKNKQGNYRLVIYELLYLSFLLFFWLGFRCGSLCERTQTEASTDIKGTMCLNLKLDVFLYQCSLIVQAIL